MFWAAAALVGGVGSAGPPAPAQACADILAKPAEAKRRQLMAEDLAGLRDIGPVTVSPDGRQIAFELRKADPSSNSYCVGIFVQQLQPGSTPRLVDVGREIITLRGRNFGFVDYPVGSPVSSTAMWSPDGRWIAYLKKVSGTVQLWRVDTHQGAEAERVAAASTDIRSFAWSGGSDYLAFTSRPVLSALEKANAEEGLRGFLYDGRFAPETSRRPMSRDPALQYDTVNLRTRAVRSATGNEIAILNPTPPAAMNDSQLWATSPTGDLAWTSRPAPRRQSEISAMERGRTHRCLVRECTDGVRKIWWSADGSAVIFLRRAGWANSITALYRWRPTDPVPSELLATPDLVDDCSPAGGELVCALETSVRPRHVVAVSLSTGALRVIFDPNPEFESIDLQPAQRLQWRNALGLETFGDLVLPARRAPGERFPLIIVGYRTRGFLRGGVGDEYPIQLFAANGFAVLSYDRPIDVSEINPTGDRSQDLAASLHEWADRKSVQSALESGIDLALESAPIDPDRIGITGLSDGESTAQWALLNGRRYAAASLSSLASQLSYVVTSGPARAEIFRRAGLKAPTEPGSQPFWASATIAANPERITTPILVQASDDEFIGGLVGYEALRAIGRPIELYVFPGEHHIKWQPAHRLSIYRRNLQWFDFWLRGVEDPHPVDPDQYRRWAVMKANNRHAARR